MSVGNILFSFRGRLNRQPYWLYGLAEAVLYIVLLGAVGAVAASMGTPGHPAPILAMRIPILILTWWIGFAMGAKRLHDRDLSAWFLLLAAVPIIGWVWFLYQAVQPGTAGENRFGPDPLKVPAIILQKTS